MKKRQSSTMPYACQGPRIKSSATWLSGTMEIADDDQDHAGLPARRRDPQVPADRAGAWQDIFRRDWIRRGGRGVRTCAASHHARLVSRLAFALDHGRASMKEIRTRIGTFYEDVIFAPILGTI